MSFCINIGKIEYAQCIEKEENTRKYIRGDGHILGHRVDDGNDDKNIYRIKDWNWRLEWERTTKKINGKLAQMIQTYSLPQSIFSF